MHYKGDCIRTVDSKTPVLGEHRLLMRERNFLNDWNNLRCWKTMKNQTTNFMSRKRAIIVSDSGGKVRISLNRYRFEMNTLEIDAGSNASQGRTVPLEGLWFFFFFTADTASLSRRTWGALEAPTCMCYPLLIVLVLHSHESRMHRSDSQRRVLEENNDVRFPLNSSRGTQQLATCIYLHIYFHIYFYAFSCWVRVAKSATVTWIVLGDWR